MKVHSDSRSGATNYGVQNEDGMIWLAGFALAFFVIALCFVSMGFLRTGLVKAGDKQADSAFLSTLAQDAGSPVQGNESGIVIISRNVSDFFTSLTRTGKPGQDGGEGEIMLADAGSIAGGTPRTIDGIAVPRLKPLSAGRAPNQPVAMPVDMNAVWLADNIRLGFADQRDFTGGKEPVFTKSERIAPLPDEPVADSRFMLRRGESLTGALARLNVREADRVALANAVAGLPDLRALKPGTRLRLDMTPAALTPFQQAALIGAPEKTPGALLNRLEFAADDMRRVEVERNGLGQLTAQITVAETQKRYATIRGTITDSLFASAARIGMPHEVASRLSNMFLYDVDFQREIYRGDSFEAVYEVFYDDQGRIVDYGDVVYGKMSWRGGKKERGYYRFADDQGTSWFDEAGSSARRLLMKTPIEGARITSSFGLRRHPVLGYTKAHKGTDFGARSGTPIMAAGDGVIERADRFGSYGNYIRIRHQAGYQTAYAHLKGFARGIRAGVRVRQGDIIGYVGTTGRSTGPHLHYEVLKSGKQVNPMTIKVANGRRLEGEELARFQDERDWIDTMLVKTRPVTLASR